MMADGRMVRTQAELREALEHGGWQVSRGPSGFSMRHPVQGTYCVLTVSLTPQLLSVVLHADWRVPRWQRAAAATDMAAVNTRSAIGTLSLEIETGLVCSRIAAPLGVDGIARQTIFDLMITAATLLHEYWPMMLQPRPLAAAFPLPHASFCDVRLLRSDAEPTSPSAAARRTFDAAHMLSDSERWRDRAVLCDAGSKKVHGSLDLAQGAGDRLNLTSAEGQRRNVALSSSWKKGDSQRAIHLGSPRSKSLENALVKAGFTQHFEEVVVHARLEDVRSLLKEAPEPAVWRDGFKLSPSAFATFLHGSPNRGLQLTAEREAIRKAVERTRVTLIGDPPLAFVAVDHDEASGSGTIVLLAVRPEARGRGLGRKLHALALASMDRAGMREYVDMTDTGNVAMQRLFFGHGARLLGSIVTRYSALDQVRKRANLRSQAASDAPGSLSHV